ncbi:PREDICTED: dynactin subunit 6-like [Rhagoletis zephyria]|uniref:dynactin subunit 6-like n=1 Tax=Rhagoletis zephyria TaxID=28612 RepID=UPI0008116E30|nr:PREDICTED: dynactin subunit 6-like [Rhagoletis zephyria]
MESVKISFSSIVCTEHTRIDGDVTIGLKNVIHPTATILAEAGPIVIGDFNLIEENVTIVNRTPGVTMVIGNHNVFEVGARSEAPVVGDHNVFESKATVGPLTRLSTGCVVGAMCAVNYDELLPENTVIFGSGCERRTQMEKPNSQLSQIDFLGKILPNYQRIERPNHRLPANLQSPTTPTSS